MKTLFYAICCVGLLWPSGLRAAEDDESMNRFVSSLLKKMTLEEKIGQLSQCAGGFATGPDNTQLSRTTDISRGLLGSMLNVSGAAETRNIRKRR